MSVDPVSFAGNRLRFFGFASGLDIDQIVSKLMQAERIPLDRLEQRRQILVWTKEDYLRISSLMDELRQALTPLKLNSTFQARTASSSDGGVVSATAAPGTPAGTHEITVTQLAKGIQLASSGAISRTSDRRTLWTQFGIDPNASPSFTLNLQVTDSRGPRSASLTFSVTDPSRDDIGDLVAAINNSGLGLTAVYDATLDRLFITSQETGGSVSLTVGDATVTLSEGGSDTVWEGLLKLGSTAAPFTGQDAVFSLDGASGLQVSTNRFTIGGVTYELKGLGTATVTVFQDTDAMVQAITAFVDKYNEALGEINGKVSERRLYDYPPLTEAQKKDMTQDEIDAWQKKARQGLLQANSLLISIASRMRLDVSNRVQGTGSVYTTLASIGITTGSYEEGGKLYVDEAKLREALQTDPYGVAALFTTAGTSSDTQGVAIRLGSTLDLAIGRIRTRAGLAGVEVDGSGLGREIALLDDQMARMEERLSALEERYYRQFSVMEEVLAQLGAQAAWLSQQFGGGG
ncbi:flagellar filament capping protein FliD [Geochorda subterranea]|uniref:Flagellar hook-associated protein 2 n=1 Tax=Geochorda subterranea TaxID=3109564 RepID=A0ABZ1BTK3_9FIRM|nr:flagellar filament capping protein FliD [Limnochorda sp. LNt]WRP15785.1 flagellar filament capping protein FliD [Limnochorda sp. LNt]